MPNKARNIRVGLFAVVIAALAIAVLVVFGGMRLWGRTDTYRIEFDDVFGLEPGAKVYLRGIPVGKVTDLAIAPDLGKVVAWIEVDHGSPIRGDTRAVLQHAGITGLKEIDLRGGSYAAPALAPGATIAQGESTLDALERQGRAIVDRSEQVLASVQRVADNLAAITDPREYAAIRRDLAATSATLRAMVGENRGAMKQSIDAFHAAARSTDALVADLSSAVRANEGPLRTAIGDLRTASRSFRELAHEVRQRPSRLLYGKPAADRKLP